MKIEVLGIYTAIYRGVHLSLQVNNRHADGVQIQQGIVKSYDDSGKESGAWEFQTVHNNLEAMLAWTARSSRISILAKNDIIDWQPIKTGWGGKR